MFSQLSDIKKQIWRLRKYLNDHVKLVYFEFSRQTNEQYMKMLQKSGNGCKIDNNCKYLKNVDSFCWTVAVLTHIFVPSTK